MEKHFRTAIGNAAQTIRRGLEEEYSEQLDGVYDIQRSGDVLPEPGNHLSAPVGRRPMFSMRWTQAQNSARLGLKRWGAVDSLL